MLEDLRSRTLIWTGPASVAGLMAAARSLLANGVPEHGLVTVVHDSEGLRIRWSLTQSPEAEAEARAS